MLRFIVSLLLLQTCQFAIAQATSINVWLEPINMEGFGGIQSFAWGRSGDKILIVGGRLDGLHRRQPFAAFDEAGHNTSLILLDMETQTVWTTPNTALPADIREQMSSTNMQFEQVGNTLYLIGGYGYSETAGDHITHPKLTAVDVDGLVSAMTSNTDIIPYFRQISDETFRVTGGHLNKLDEVFYLSGGQNFEGRYNPQGPDFGPGFVQEYTNSIRRFTISDDGVNLEANVLPSWEDSENLHRRDYNVVDQIMPDGTHGFTAFSGVFRTDADLPYLNCVNVNTEGYTVNNDFAQYYNHYHCATLPLYSSQTNEMCTVFFGGIAQYYDAEGMLTQDDNVPFVKTIGMVCRTSSGEMTEYKLQTEMPGLIGAGSEFIRKVDLPHFANGVIDYDALTEDSTFVGYIIGGISSSASNIFFSNTVQSEALTTIFKVHLIKNTTTGTPTLNTESNNDMQMLIYPNPTGGEFQILYNNAHSGPVEIEIRESSGKIIHQKQFVYQRKGQHSYHPELDAMLPDGTYLVMIKSNRGKSVQKIILSH